MPTLQATRTEFKVGDPALYDFKEVTVEEVYKGSPTSVRDAYFSYGIGRSNVFPVTEEGQKIASFFKGHYDYLHMIDGEGAGIFNWPDIAGHLQQRFDRAMFALMKGDRLGANREMNTTREFVSLAADCHNRAKSLCADGVYVIGRR